MRLNIILKEFCDKLGYTGDIKFNQKSGKYRIVISKDGHNGGAFLSKEEYKELDEEKLIEILELLHTGFKQNFK